ncbi:class I SAM-dependent methyltransferase [Streptomyces sp. CB03911]|uniref:class I SAM-dependent methyltransferase n=1 Tax=Streptomyces sp. CB03911 TaxID=1804758 RepID=UPI00093DCF2F|nr:class I SAM-dependent methyltransferase [Streptomyces sp. CB03911]
MASAQATGTTAQHPRAADRTAAHGPGPGRARDWAEIQERMLVPLYEAVYDRLEVGPATSVLGLGCRSGLALLLASGRGAQVAGQEPHAELRQLAQDRRLRVGAAGRTGPASGDVPRTAYSLVTVFEQLPGAAEPGRLVAEAAGLTLPGGHVVLAAWGPPERCESAAVLDVARRRAGRTTARDPFALSSPGGLEDLLTGAGLRPAGSGRVSCPFAYADLDSAVRGLLSTGLYDAAVEFSGGSLVAKELEEALHPYLLPGGAVRMANVFRYVVAERIR